MLDMLSEGCIFGLGNPLLDLIAHVDETFLNKWELKPNNAILAEDKHAGLDQDMIDNYSIEYSAGGSVQNTLRIVEWLLNFKPKLCTMIGGIGKDTFGEIMSKKTLENALNCRYYLDDKSKTGYCCVLVTNNGKNRSLCAFLGAANNLKLEHIIQNWDSVEKAKVFYISGFHVTVCFAAMLKIAQFSNQHDDRVFVYNLGAPYVNQFYNQQVLELLPLVDTVIGNEDEAYTLAEVNNWKTKDLSEIVLKLAHFEKQNSKKVRLAIITQGSQPILVASSDSQKVKQFPVCAMDPCHVVDTNGAGDAFVAGYLSQFVLGKSLEERIKVAIYAAQEIIKQSGTQCPSHPPNY